VPITVTEKAAVCPVATVWLTGCVVIDGATAALLLALLTSPAHPEREKLVSSARTIARRSPTFLVPNDEYLEVLIWPRQLNKLRAELQHAPLPTVNTVGRRPIHLT
jgi:hypothetical protein